MAMAWVSPASPRCRHSPGRRSNTTAPPACHTATAYFTPAEVQSSNRETWNTVSGPNPQYPPRARARSPSIPGRSAISLGVPVVPEE